MKKNTSEIDENIEISEIQKQLKLDKKINKKFCKEKYKNTRDDFEFFFEYNLKYTEFLESNFVSLISENKKLKLLIEQHEGEEFKEQVLNENVIKRNYLG